jgi:methyl-accepting chemotaxis protein
MFGNKRKLSQEELLHLQESIQKGETIAERLAQRRDVLESDCDAMRKSREQMGADTRQVSENTQNILEYAKQNSISASEICGRLDACGQELQRAWDEYNGIISRIEQQTEECQQLVEQNKHFTTPSKNLSELPAELHSTNQDYLKHLEEMSDCGKQMGVLALNAAIEAGRMGESGRGFVGAAEEIRNCAKQYESAAGALKDRIEESEERIEALEETVHHLVGLLKENNVGTAKLMRSSQDLGKQTKKAAIRDFSGDLIPIREEVTGIYNVEEEVIKSGERSRMQLDDILEEIRTQQDNGDEISVEWDEFCQDMTAWSEYIKNEVKEA